jgi:hypothetical protein
MEDLMKEYRAQIEALRNENERLNKELKRFKDLAFKTQLSDPNYHKPISDSFDLVVNEYEIITPEK